VNAEKVYLTGNKIETKSYYRHTGYAGGIKASSVKQILEGRRPEQVIKKSIRRMLGDGPLAEKRFRNLYVYSGPDHPHGGQQPRFLDVAALNPKNQKDRPVSDSRSFEPKIEAIVERVVQKHVAPLHAADEKLLEGQRRLADDFADTARRLIAAQESTDRAIAGLSDNQSGTNKRLDKVESTLEVIQKNTADTNEILQKILIQLSSGSPAPG